MMSIKKKFLFEVIILIENFISSQKAMDYDAIERDFKALKNDFSELQKYEVWSGIAENFKKLLEEDSKNQKLLFKNYEGDNQDDVEPEHQENLCKKYRKFINKLTSQK